MKKLRIKFWQNENIVMMKILEQDESLRDKGKIFKNDDLDMAIYSNCFPAITLDGIFIKGDEKEKDDLVRCFSFDSIKDATDYIGKCQILINNYNMSLEEVEIEEVIKSYIFE